MPFENLTAVVVDDDMHCCSFAEEVTRMVGLRVKGFTHSLDALEYARENAVDMIVTDFQMPEMDGVTLIEEIRKLHCNVPAVMMTGYSGAGELSLHTRPGLVSELFEKPFSAADFLDRVKPLANLRQFMKLVGTYRLRDELGKHRKRVGHYARIIAGGLNWDREGQDLLFHAAQAHDLGMVSVPDSIFYKAESLTASEKEIIRMHPIIGRSIFNGNANPYFKTASTVSLMHHERFNGSGYPVGLSGEAIPVAGRIAGMVDVFDVLTSDRSYRLAWSFDKAFDYITDNHEMLFDPELVNIFEEKAENIRQVHTAYAD